MVYKNNSEQKKAYPKIRKCLIKRHKVESFKPLLVVSKHDGINGMHQIVYLG